MDPKPPQIFIPNLNQTVNLFDGLDCVLSALNAPAAEYQPDEDHSGTPSSNPDQTTIGLFVNALHNLVPTLRKVHFPEHQPDQDDSETPENILNTHQSAGLGLFDILDDALFAV